MTENDEWKSNYGLIIICNYVPPRRCAARSARQPAHGRAECEMFVLPRRRFAPPRSSRTAKQRTYICEMLSVFSYHVYLYYMELLYTHFLNIS